MNLLLDTHVVLWWRLNDRRLLPAARRAIEAADRVIVSAASAWEIVIKIAIGRLRLQDSFGDLVAQAGFDMLPVAFPHAERLATLPPHHSDPFDRMLIAQALEERLTVISHDRDFAAYDVPIVWT